MEDSSTKESDNGIDLNSIDLNASLSCFFPELAIKWGVTNDEENDNVSSSNRNDSSSNMSEVSVVLTNKQKRDSLTLINTPDVVISSEEKQRKDDVIEKHNAALFNIFCFTAFLFGIFVTITTLFLYFKNENDAISINNRLRISSDKSILILSSLSSNTTAATKNIEMNGDGISNEMIKPIKERRHDYTNNIIQKDDNNFLEDLCSEENILLDVSMKEKCLNACVPSKCCFLKNDYSCVNITNNDNSSSIEAWCSMFLPCVKIFHSN